MSTCISRHGEYSSHTYGEGAERFVCQRCGVLDEDAMLAALATAEAEVERLRDEVTERLRQFNIAKDQRDIMVTRADRVAAAEAETKRAEHDLAVAVAEATTARAERDALSARLQAVRDAAGSLLAALDEQQWCDYGDHTGTTWEDCAVVEASEDALRAALDASLGTPGNETAKEADWFRETPASLAMLEQERAEVVAKEARWGGLLTNPDGSVSPVGSSGSAE